jgi:hypothetical protein
MRRWRGRFEFQPRDLWIGVYWKDDGLTLDVWICVLPCIPLHLQFGPAHWDW